MQRALRHIYKFLGPAWLNTSEDGLGQNDRVHYSLKIILDAFRTTARLALEARFPSRAGDSANALIGADRGLIRGRDEDRDSYAARLAAFRYPRGHRVRGNAFALLEQIAAYWGASKVDVFTVDAKRVRNRRQADGTLTTTYSTEWTWDLDPEEWWARFWVVLLCTPALGIDYQPDWGDPLLWNWGDSGVCVGITGATPEDFVTMRRLLRGRAWKPAGTRAEWLIVSKDGTLPFYEAGDQKYWGVYVGGVYFPGRDPDFRYVSLSPEANNTFAGDPTLWPDAVRLPGGADVAGDPTSYPENVTLPSGRVYSGDPTRYPDRVLLLDDGDPPRAT